LRTDHRLRDHRGHRSITALFRIEQVSDESSPVHVPDALLETRCSSSQLLGVDVGVRSDPYVEDLCRVNAQLLEDDRADGEILNIGSTDTIDILTLAEVIRDEIDPTLDLVFDNAREGDAEHTHADVSKAVDLLGYEPTFDIREGVRKSIAWYRENEDWYDPLLRNS
jgi:UDP-glucose 4-epimerase